jgi:hypothetical protein
MRLVSCHYMFVLSRLSKTGRRLQLSLAETRRVAGKVRRNQVASLGTIDSAPSVADRIVFWRDLYPRLDRLSNRLDEATRFKVIGDVHALIPMVTPDEQRALQLENAEADARFWESMRDMHQATADDNKGLATTVETTIASAQAGAETAGAKAEAAKERVTRLKRGEDVSGGLGNPFTREDAERVMRDAGLTDRDIEKSRIVARLSDLGGFDEYVAEVDKVHARARRGEHRAARRVLSRRLSLAGKKPPGDG